MSGLDYFHAAASVHFDPEERTCPVCQKAEAFEHGGAYDICGQCGWEDCPVQRFDPTNPLGPNGKSLYEARAEWTVLCALEALT